MRVVLLVIALVFPAPALAQDAPAELYESAPSQAAGAAGTTDEGRSEVLLGLAVVAFLGAGALGVIAFRGRWPDEPEPVEAEVEREIWRPHVKSDLPPLPAFRSGPEPPAG
jgi:hypothetical protein